MQSVPWSDLPYLAPEALDRAGKNEPTTSADMWAFGVVAYAMVARNMPFRDVFTPRLAKQIQDARWDEAPLQEASKAWDCGEAIVALVKGCLSDHVDMRWNITQVVEKSNAWLT